MIAKRAFVLLLLAACGGREERAPVSRPSATVAVTPAPVAPAEPADAVARDAGGGDASVDSGPVVVPTVTLRESDVRITGGLGYGNDAFVRADDPKPGDRVDVVRVFCHARGKPEEEKKYSCAGATAATSEDGKTFARRVRECFDVRERPATTAEALKVASALRDSASIDVPRGSLYAVETRFSYRAPETRSVHCQPMSGHPCDPRTVETGKTVEVAETTAHAVGPKQLDASHPFWTWPLVWFDVVPEPVSLEGQPRVVRLAVLHDRAVDAVRSRDAARIAAAVKALDDEYDGGKGVTFAPMVGRLPRDLEALRALAGGRATIGDACKDRRK